MALASLVVVPRCVALGFNRFLPDESFVLLFQKRPTEFLSELFQRSRHDSLLCTGWTTLLLGCGWGQNKITSRLEYTVNFNKKQSICFVKSLLVSCHLFGYKSSEGQLPYRWLLSDPIKKKSKPQKLEHVTIIKKWGFPTVKINFASAQQYIFLGETGLGAGFKTRTNNLSARSPKKFKWDRSNQQDLFYFGEDILYCKGVSL